MFKTQSGKHFANPQQGAFHDKHEHAGKEESHKAKAGEASTPEKQGAEEGVPHPSTGVRKVEIVHKGNNRFVTRVHDDNGQSEHEHGGAHEGISQAFPEPADNETQGADVMGGADETESLAGMLGGQ